MWRATGGPRNIQARIPGTAGAHTGLSNLYIWGTRSFGVPRCGQSKLLVHLDVPESAAKLEDIFVHSDVTAAR